MAHTRVYCPQLVEGTVKLSPEESHHAVVVRRRKAGDDVVLFDGAGGEAPGRVLRADRRAMTVNLERITRHPPDLKVNLTLAVALGKAQRQSYVIEKCTELGVVAIRPLSTDRSVAKPGPATLEKWKRRAVEAAKQSGRHWLPEIGAAATLTQVIDQFDRFESVAFADTSGARTGWDRVLASAGEGRELLLLVGPEGGWSPDERMRLAGTEAVPVTLGPTVLRTETAAVAACAAAALRSVALLEQ